ncbi:MAG: Short-chain dehydrogenase [Frankiales bacterium]|jgi:short-subunit dehydrogenase|nr:Short-chain dehydrogenase [Frankiales bacterium]
MTDPAPLAVVTGASSGIGLELARQFAAAGFDLVVNAEDAELTAAAASLRETGVSVQEVRADLSSYDGVEQLWAAVQATGRPVAAAALNAGVGKGGAFLDNDLADELQLIRLNVDAVVHLAKRLLADMVARGAGRLLVTSSIASTMPGPYQAVYNASKSFVQSFVEALQSELRDSPVTLTSLMPGPTETEFFDRAGLRNTLLGRPALHDDPAQVAEQGFRALMEGKDKVVGGSLMTKAQAVVNALLPDTVKAAGHRLAAKPRDEPRD